MEYFESPCNCPMRRQVVFTIYVSAFFFSRITLAVYRFPVLFKTESGAISAYFLFALNFVGVCWVVQWAEDEVRRALSTIMQLPPTRQAHTSKCTPKVCLGHTHAVVLVCAWREDSKLALLPTQRRPLSACFLASKSRLCCVFFASIESNNSPGF